MTRGRDYRVRRVGGWARQTRWQLPHLRSSAARKLPLRVGRKEVGALEISRLALPLPSLLPSVNQIGFDSYDLIAGTLAKGRTDGGSCSG